MNNIEIPRFAPYDGSNIDHVQDFHEFLDEVGEKVKEEMTKVLVSVFQVQQIEITPENVKDIVTTHHDFVFSFAYDPEDGFHVECELSLDYPISTEIPMVELDESCRMHQLVAEQVYGWFEAINGEDSMEEDDTTVEMLRHFYNCIIYRSAGEMFALARLSLYSVHKWEYGNDLNAFCRRLFN